MRLIDRKGNFFIATLGLSSLLFAVLWLGNLPSANAQVPTHVFKGKVNLDGQPAPDGTPLRVFVDGRRISDVDTTVIGGQFVFPVAQPQGQRFQGKIVEFAMQTPEGRRWFRQIGEWQPGGETTVLLQDPGPVGVGRESLRPAQNTPRVEVHVFKGRVFVDGQPAPNGTPLRVFVNGQRIGAADRGAAGGRYEFWVAQPQGQSFLGKTVTFATQTPEGRRWFPQTVEWQPGGETNVVLRVPLPVGVGLDLKPARVENTTEAKVRLFKGNVDLDGRPAPDGTRIMAFIDGVWAMDTKTKDGRYELLVPQDQSMAGKTVQFIGRTVDRRELRFPQTGVWMAGGYSNVSLALRGTTSFPVAEEIEVHVFQGPVDFDGRPAPDGTLVWAMIN